MTDAQLRPYVGQPVTVTFAGEGEPFRLSGFLRAPEPGIDDTLYHLDPLEPPPESYFAPDSVAEITALR